MGHIISIPPLSVSSQTALLCVSGSSTSTIIRTLFWQYRWTASAFTIWAASSTARSCYKLKPCQNWMNHLRRVDLGWRYPNSKCCDLRIHKISTAGSCKSDITHHYRSSVNYCKYNVNWDYFFLSDAKEPYLNFFVSKQEEGSSSVCSNSFQIWLSNWRALYELH